MAVTISRSLFERSIPPLLLLLSIVLLAASYTINIYYTIPNNNNNNSVLWVTHFVLFYSGLLLWIGVECCWHFKLLYNNNNKNKNKFSDLKTSLFLFAGTFYITACHICAARLLLFLLFFILLLLSICCCCHRCCCCCCCCYNCFC